MWTDRPLPPPPKLFSAVIFRESIAPVVHTKDGGIVYLCRTMGRYNSPTNTEINGKLFPTSQGTSVSTIFVNSIPSVLVERRQSVPQAKSGLNRCCVTRRLRKHERWSYFFHPAACFLILLTYISAGAQKSPLVHDVGVRLIVILWEHRASSLQTWIQ